MVSNNSIGLVLSGGGAKGAYETGAYKALEQFGITERITAIAGTSVGALNAVLLENLGSKAEDVWLKLKITDLMHLDGNRFTKILDIFTSPSSDSTQLDTIDLNQPNAALKALSPALYELLYGGLPFSQNRLASLIDTYIDLNKLNRDIFVVCLKSKRSPLGIPVRSAECFHLNGDYPKYNAEQKKQIILASAALPGFFCGTDGVEIKGVDGTFFDGGYSSHGQNTPVSALYDKGYRKIIAVHLNSDPDISEQSQFTDADIVNIIPSEDMGGILTGTLNLNNYKVRRDLKLGYEDTLSLIPSIKLL